MTNKNASGVNSLTFDIALSREQYLNYYRGAARSVLTRARTGETLQLPASVLRPYVSAEGVHGSFRIIFDDTGTLMDMSPVH